MMFDFVCCVYWFASVVVVAFILFFLVFVVVDEFVVVSPSICESFVIPFKCLTHRNVTTSPNKPYIAHQH